MTAVKLSNLEERLLLLMSDGCFYSSQGLAIALYIDEFAVDIIIKKLIGIGIRISFRESIGYKLDYVPQRLHKISEYNKNIIYFDSIESTNDFALNNEFIEGTIIYSETQTKGRGRQLKKYVCQYGTQLIFSYITYFSEYTQLSGLSLVIGLAICEFFQSKNISCVKVKWPNDVYINNKKVCGVLVESKFVCGKIYTVIGIGINYSKEFMNYCPKEIRSIVTSIELECEHIDDKESLFINLVNKISSTLNEFKKNKFNNLLKIYNENMLYQGQEVVLFKDGEEHRGLCIGITSDGELLLQSAKGTFETFVAGDLHLRVN
ncbi:MAG: biotin--[acetyl-CoA-carboxylase] ligase [Succinivibrionaceae bacterium]